MESNDGCRDDQILGSRDVEREMMKESIRREILEGKAARRRELEEEVWREIMLEREMEFRGREMEFRERERRLEVRETELEVREKKLEVREKKLEVREKELEVREREFEVREKELVVRERDLEVRERDLEVRERGSDHARSGRYVEVGLFEKRVALSVEEGMHDIPRLEWEKQVGDNAEELPIERASQPTKTSLRTASDIFRVKDKGLPFERALQPYKTEVMTFFKVKELQTNKTEVKTSSDAVEVKELPPQHALPPNKTEVGTSSDVVRVEENKQNIFLANLDANHSGMKRKDMASPVEDSSEVTKKLANMWSCALCQISTTSEQGLQDHLKGKKHRSTQAGLRAVRQRGAGGQRACIIGLAKKFNDPLTIKQVGERNVEIKESQQTSNEPLNINQVGEKNVELEESQQTSNEPLNISQVGEKNVELEESQQTSNDPSST